jgi:hypothetical protein
VKPGRKNRDKKPFLNLLQKISVNTWATLTKKRLEKLVTPVKRAPMIRRLLFFSYL